ncbi:MAG: UvrD-helicase domain-containing protein [bacterium]|nr:UvrD-helicase domain-containing protein [bacterium]
MLAWENESRTFKKDKMSQNAGQSLTQQAQRAMSRPAADYLEGLNSEQRDAVETLHGPVLVLAGAGTGKTRVLITRIAHILAMGEASSFNILAVTFTNKAALEMKNRVGQLVGGAVEGMPWLGTFHAICVKILRRHAELVGLKSGFTILDADDQVRLIKQLLKAENIDEKRWPARHLASLFDRWKNKGLMPSNVPVGEAHSFANGKGAELYEAYQKRLKELNAVDFGDILLECLRLFQENNDVLKEYQSRFRYILVDEYQDTNVAQYLWLRLLTQGTSNVCCVGDDDQSIYGWRGAEVDNILRFDKDFPGAKVIRLEQNYRSTGHILATASTLIDNNTERLGKTLHTNIGEGDKVMLRGCWDDEEEARNISEQIEQLQRDNNNHNLNDIAILVRASSQMRAIEDRFVTVGLPYRVIGGPRFYERKEIKDAIAYFEVIFNSANDLKFERIINTPKRGLGEASLRPIYHYARAKSIPLVDSTRALLETEELRPAARNAISKLMDQFDHWGSMAQMMDHTELAQIILDESGYTAMWQNDKTPQAPGRLDNLKELIRFMEEFDSMAEFLEHVSLVMDVDSGNEGERVSLMTLHSAKGLEFETVFLPGWEEGLFPHQRALDESGKAGLEEERRLAYVGVTRAKRRSTISFAQNRRTHGQWQTAAPSRFIDELPQEHVEVMDSQSYGGYAQTAQPSRFKARESFAKDMYSEPRWNKGAKSGNRTTTVIEGRAKRIKKVHKSDFSLGERIFHQKFGYGAITSIEGDKLTINFEKAGEKRVVESFVEKT